MSEINYDNIPEVKLKMKEFEDEQTNKVEFVECEQKLMCNVAFLCDNFSVVLLLHSLVAPCTCKGEEKKKPEHIIPIDEE